MKTIVRMMLGLVGAFVCLVLVILGIRCAENVRIAEEGIPISELEQVAPRFSPSGKYVIAETWWIYGDVVRKTVSVAHNDSSEKLQWVPVFEWPWPTFSNRDMRWVSDQKVVVTCDDQTWFGMPDEVVMQSPPVTIVFEEL